MNSMIEEMRAYNPPGYMAQKAERVCRMCIKHGHMAWAVRIREKNYGRLPQSDMTIALGFSLMASKIDTK